MKFVQCVFAFAAIVGLFGCATPVKLEAGADKVQLVEYIKPELRDKLVEIDQVKCQLGENARTRDANIEGCQNTLRNEAAKRGGTIVLLNKQERYELSSSQKFFPAFNSARTVS